MSSWNYVVTAHKPTNVTHSCVGYFTNPQELNLIIAYPFYFSRKTLALFHFFPLQIATVLSVCAYSIFFRLY